MAGKEREAVKYFTIDDLQAGIEQRRQAALDFRRSAEFQEARKQQEKQMTETMTT